MVRVGKKRLHFRIELGGSNRPVSVLGVPGSDQCVVNCRVEQGQHPDAAVVIEAILQGLIHGQLVPSVVERTRAPKFYAVKSCRVAACCQLLQLRDLCSRGGGVRRCGQAELVTRTQEPGFPGPGLRFNWTYVLGSLGVYQRTHTDHAETYKYPDDKALRCTHK